MKGHDSLGDYCDDGLRLLVFLQCGQKAAMRRNDTTHLLDRAFSHLLDKIMDHPLQVRPQEDGDDDSHERKRDNPEAKAWRD